MLPSHVASFSAFSRPGIPSSPYIPKPTRSMQQRHAEKKQTWRNEMYCWVVSWHLSYSSTTNLMCCAWVWSCKKPKGGEGGA